jgi:hypothetical protein
MSDHPHQPAPLTAQTLTERGTELSRQIALALEQPAAEVVSAAAGAIPLAAALRDSLIAQRRAGASNPTFNAALTRANTIITLLSAVGYPEGPPQRAYLEQARTLASEIVSQSAAAMSTSG